MTTTTEVKGGKGKGSADVLAVLASGDPMPLGELVEMTGIDAVAAAWAKGEIELGTTKYVVAGNPNVGEQTHNGVVQAKPAVIIEGGIEWAGPRTRSCGRLSDVLREKLPQCRTYQKYQLEMCVNKEKDIWEWVERPEHARDRETRYARREIDRAEAEKLWDHYARLTDKGMGSVV